MLDAGTYLVPTLIAPLGLLEAADRGIDLPAVILDKCRAVVDVHRQSIRKAIDAGVNIAMGTDSGVTPHGQNLRELRAMAELGMSPSAVFESSTRVAAELMDVDSNLDTLEIGKLADAAMVSGTELDVSDLHPRVERVFQAGDHVA